MAHIEVKVSPKFTTQKLASGAIEDRIDVFEDRWKGWLFEPARALLKVPYAGFAVVQLCLGYFEGWAQWRWGENSKNKSAEFFRRGVHDVFPSVDWADIERRAQDREAITNALYEQARCGLFHDGMPRRQLFVGPVPAPLSVSAHKETGELGAILIDPQKFLEHIEYHFKQYVAALRDPAQKELRDNFMKTWERVHAGGPVHFASGLPSIPQV